jgi:ATP-dependent DNA ligase
MPFVDPMLASPLRPELLLAGQWVAEEKFDGIRLVVEVSGTVVDLFGHPRVDTWSRYGKAREVPPHIRLALSELPAGVYDGELYVPGKRSYGTAALENAAEMVLTIFDVVSLLGRDTRQATYSERRALLEEIFRERTGPVTLSETHPVVSLRQAEELVAWVWERDGEGLILKRVDSLYWPGKRRPEWMKMKQLRSAVCTVIGYREGKMGPQSTLLLEDDQGYQVTVKWRNLAELARLEADPGAYIGRRLRIEYQERTPDGSYRHPRWDRWEEE